MHFKYNLVLNLFRKAVRLTDIMFLNEVEIKVFKMFLSNWHPLVLIKKLWDKCSGNVKTKVPYELMRLSTE